MSEEKIEMIVVWFSCGAASAVAAKKTLERYGDTHRIVVVNNPVKEEDEDNRRFLMDIEAWLGVDIEIAVNPDYPSHSASEVWDDRAYMSGNLGAPCTIELKKEARYFWESVNKPDWHVLGFTADERGRFDRFVLEERPNTIPVLIDAGLTKQNCFNILMDAGIRPPAAYGLGYPNANCYGCVKATSPTYWNHVRQTHPEVFQQRAEQSRRIGARLVRVKDVRIFLDELSPEAKGRKMKNIKMPECGIFCDINKILKP